MKDFQPETPKMRNVLRNVTLSCAILVALSACSNSSERAGADGAAAEQQLAIGNVAAARQAINRAITGRDDIVELYLLKGRIELAGNSSTAAFDAYSDALSLDSANPEALQAVSQLGLTTGHLIESFRATQQILSLDPTSENALVVRGIHALIRRRYDEAIGYANKVLERSPKREDAAILKSRGLFLKGDNEAALATLDAAGANASASAAVALTKLEIFRELRQPRAMAEQFDTLRKMRPYDGELMLDEANMRFKLGERSSAHRLIGIALSDPKATSELVGAAIDLWREYGAEEVQPKQFQQIATSGAASTRESVIRFLIESGQLSIASQMLATLNGNVRDGLAARLEVRRGRHELALKLAKIVLGRDATQCDALIARSEASRGTGDLELALMAGQKAVAECPERPATYIAAASAYLALGRPSGTQRLYRQAVDAYPRSLRLARAYTEWLLSKGRTREALATSRRLTRKAPALLGGWRYFAGVCRRARADCEDEALLGLKDAETRYGVDLEPSAYLTTGLVGRLRR